MSDEKPAVKARCELTVEEATQSLNYFDLQAIRKEFGVGLTDGEASEVEITYGITWIMEKRLNPNVRASVVKNFSLQEIADYYPESKTEDVDSGGETELGKD